MRRFSLLLLLLAVPGLAACDLNVLRRTPILSDNDFAKELHVDAAAMVETGSGLKYQDVTIGEGAEATRGVEAVVHYTGWLTNGTKFDSSVDRGEPFSFPLGKGRVIAGWDEGVAGMRVGGRRKLVIPAELGYGARGGGPIPPNATLVFEVELLEIR